MNQSLLLARKDLAILFRSPLAYLIMACFLAVTGYFFVSMIGYYELVGLQLMRNPGMSDFTPTQMIFPTYLSNASVVLLFVLPLLTMRGFSEEKRMGTFEVLISYPLTETQLVVGKLFALAVFLLALLVGSGLSLVLLNFFASLEPLPILSGYLGAFLMGLSFLSLGLFLSSLTENQMLSALFAFAALLILWMLSYATEMGAAPWLKHVAELSPVTHLKGFTEGVIEASDLVYYLGFTLAFGFLNVLSLENQRWRG